MLIAFRGWHRGLAVGVLLLTAARAVAQESVPAPLAPWVPWVRAQDEDAACPVRDGQALCFWPGPLSLALRGQEGSFRFDVRLDRRLLVRLPGGSGTWPQAVRVAGKPAAVVSKDGVPALDLLAGDHTVDGRFAWSRSPEQLPVPPEFGQLSVSLDNKPVPHPRRDESGSLWLRSAAGGGEPEQLELTVQRKLEDAVPLRIETRIRIRAAGEPREISLGNVMVAGSVPLAIQAQLPVRLDPNGELRLQVRAGTYDVVVRARTRGPRSELASTPRPAPWPEQEAWVFQPDTALRQVRVAGAPAVDPARLELDADLRGLPTFLLGPSDKLTLEELRRGEPEPPPNQLSLERTLWLDQDGHGYTVHDRLSGELHSGFRLELREGQLGRAAQGDQDQLITQRTASGPLGVELRAVNVALAADSRLEKHTTSLPAVGWSEDVRQLGVTLHLPPGYALWAVRGVDEVDRSWLGDWDLLGFFFVLVVAFGTAGVAGRWAGVLAFVALGLTYQESDAPSTVWLWLLAAAALLRVLPRGRLWQVTRAVFVIALISLAVTGLPFAARSVREAIYPQLAAARGGLEFAPSMSFGIGMRGAPPELEPQAASAPLQVQSPPGEAGGAVPVEEKAEEAADESLAGASSKSAKMDDARPRRRLDSYAADRKKPRAEQDPDAVVQTGPGLPDWQFQSWQLRWSGPVAHDHHFELIMLPPWLNSGLHVLSVVLCGLLAWLIVAAAGAFREQAPVPPPVAAALAALLLLGAAGGARAQFPDAQLLEQLKARVSRPPDCRPNCVSVSELELSVDPKGLSLRAEVHAQDRTSVRVPGPLALWAPERVRLNGAEAHLIAHPDGFLHVRVTPGVQQLEVSGPLPPEDTLTLRLGDPPAHVRVRADGYEVSGVREDGTSEEAIELRRLLREAEAAAVSLPPWFSVTRSFEFANEFRVHTSVERETPLGTPALLHLPLLPSESVHDARVQVKDRQALVSLGPDDQGFSFDSTLAQSAQLELQANARDAYSERWELSCGSMWQCDATGLTPVRHEAEQRWQPLFRPWPGERLKIALKKPPAAAGQSSTLDGVKLVVKPGVRATDGELSLALRTSRGGDHKLWLPEQARLRSLSVGGERRSTQRDGSAYGFSVLPGGSQVVVQFELPSGIEGVYTVPQVKLDARARNARVVVEQPADRWLLWVRGPAWGPAILFWGYLLLALGVAALLGRLRGTPLGTLQWLLLAAGLTQVDAVEALCVVGFFFIVGWRGRTLELSPWRHNLLQIALCIWLLAFASTLFDAVRSGLLVQPDMQVMGAGSYANMLQWYVDDSQPALPTPTLISLPIWVYRVLMLAWSLWLARQLLRWAPWAFRAFAAGGLWKKRIKAKPPVAAPPPPAEATPAP
ncbi:MAG TPA: hypothetical protein VJV78_19125 [Polyangiales bacterium]|nr:hypothetical protein [Polyangiales bacterium]